MCGELSKAQFAEMAYKKPLKQFFVLVYFVPGCNTYVYRVLIVNETLHLSIKIQYVIVQMFLALVFNKDSYYHIFSKVTLHYIFSMQVK